MSRYGTCSWKLELLTLPDENSRFMRYLRFSSVLALVESAPRCPPTGGAQQRAFCGTLIFAAVLLCCGGCGRPTERPVKSPGPRTQFVAGHLAVEPEAIPAKRAAPSADDVLINPPTIGNDDSRTASDPPSSGNMIGNLRNFIESSEVLESAGAQSGLIEMLGEAESSYSRIKDENREALRRLNRQIRVGAAELSPHLILVQLPRCRWNAWGCYGGPPTPTIDRLASEGTRFTSFYAGSADPAKSRWCLLTGSGGARPSPKSPDKQLSENPRSLPELLWLGGYSTAFIGNWGLGSSPLECGYEEFTGFATNGECRPYPESIAVDRSRLRFPGNANGGESVHCDRLLANESRNFIERSVRQRRHFFLHIVLPSFETPDDGPSDSDSQRLDHFLEELSRTLDALRLTSRTALFLTAESGPLDEHPGAEFRSFPHGLGEGNLRIPLIVRWPGKVQPQTSDRLHALWDIPATFAEIAMLTRKPIGSDGQSFLPALLGTPAEGHPLLYWRRDDGAAQAVRLGEWKGIVLAGEKEISLFHLAADQGESESVASQHPDIVQRMLAPAVPR